MRHAIYYAPPRTEVLGRLGATWLGRDAETGEALPQPPVEGLSPADVARLTAEPRRYGFHATLMPPFALAAGLGEADVLNEADALARALAPVDLLPLEVRRLSGFLALVQTQPAGPIVELAARCVRTFHRLRAPPTEDELARRRSARLTANQEVLLARWGYPYVFDEFRLHMSLTGPVMDAEAASLLPALRRYFAPACAATWRVSALTVFCELSPGAPFTLRARFPLRSPEAAA